MLDLTAMGQKVCVSGEAEQGDAEWATANRALETGSTGHNSLPSCLWSSSGTGRSNSGGGEEILVNVAEKEQGAG